MIKKLLVLTVIIFTIKTYTQENIESCDQIEPINNILTIHGEKHLHVTCEDESVLITSTSNDINGTIISGFLDTTEIRILPGDSFVKITPEDETKEILKHKTKLGNGGVGFKQMLNDNELNINLYPNPTKEKITINTTEKIKKIELFNNYGFKQPIINNNNILNLKTHKKGIYLLKIHLQNNQIITKTIIKN